MRPSLQMRLVTGMRLGPYEIVSAIGAGGMGEVYRARDPRLGRDVAIKVIASEGAPDPERLRRFEQEAKAVAALDHPHILAIHDVGAEDGTAYVVFELLEGETLRDKLGRGAIAPRKLVELAVPICHGLAAAHARGIVHRDLKPENLFLTKDGRIKILDFGLARLSEAASPGEQEDVQTRTATEPGQVMGTAGYMSPEQVRGKPADARSDLFALGAILYETLTGQRAFRGATAADTMSAVLNHEPPEPTTPCGPAPVGLERVVRRCLEKDPEQRFQSARDVAFALEAVSSGSSASSGAAAPPPPRKPLRMLAAAAALLAIAGPAAFLLGQKRAERPLPEFKRLTFRRGSAVSARFSNDGHTIVFSAAWEGDPLRLFSVRDDSRESRRLELPDGDIHAVSSRGELAIAEGRPFQIIRDAVTLARAPLSGGAPREFLEGVYSADWSPDGQNLAIVRQAGEKARLEYPVGKVLVETSVENIVSIRVSPQGDRVAFCGYKADGFFVAVVDRAGQRTNLSGGWKWGGQQLAWTPSGREVWFTATESDWFTPLYAVDLSGRRRVVLRLPNWVTLQDFAPDGRALMTIGTNRSESFVVLPGATRERNISWHEGSSVVHLSADGKTLFFNEVVEGREGGIYMRPTDGSPAVRLGEGQGQSLSPDGRWVATGKAGKVTLLPTRAGEAKAVEIPAAWVRFFPDGKRLLTCEGEGGPAVRVFVRDLEGGPPIPLAKGTHHCHWVSPDGKDAACVDLAKRGWLYPASGAKPRPIPGFQAADSPVQWTTDPRFLYVARPPMAGRAKIDRLDLHTGQREPFREIVVPDPTGLLDGPSVVITPDGRSYAYTVMRSLSDLYLVTGLR